MKNIFTLIYKRMMAGLGIVRMQLNPPQPKTIKPVYGEKLNASEKKYLKKQKLFRRTGQRGK